MGPLCSGPPSPTPRTPDTHRIEVWCKGAVAATRGIGPSRVCREVDTTEVQWFRFSSEVTVRLVCCKMVNCFCPLDSSLVASFSLQGLWLGSIFLPMTELLDSSNKFSLHFHDTVFQVISRSSCGPVYCLTNRRWGTVWTDLVSSWDLLKKKKFLMQPCTLHFDMKAATFTRSFLYRLCQTRDNCIFLGQVWGEAHDYQASIMSEMNS